MNLASCAACGIVVDLKAIEMELEYVDDKGNPMDAMEASHEEQFGWENNPNLIWGGGAYLDTWKCPVCKNFNGIDED